MRQFVCALLPLLLVLVTIEPAWANPVCRYCHRTITGQYYEVGGQSECVSCHDAHALRCVYCGKKIAKKYYTDKKGKVICESCFTSRLPKCAVCQQPLTGQYHIIGGKNYCSKHAQATVGNCSSCGRSLLGGHYKVDQNGHNYCTDCYGRLGKCFSCGAPVSNKNGKMLSDGRLVCNTDLAHAVLDSQTMKKYYNFGLQHINQTFGKSLAVPSDHIEVSMVNSSELVSKAKAQTLGSMRGLCLTRTFLGQSRSHIYLLSAQTPEDMETAAVHECAHAWQAENNQGYFDSSLRFKEGFAQWVSYKVNQKLGRKKQMEKLINNQETLYAEGLRDFLNLEKRVGTNGVINTARNRTSI